MYESRIPPDDPPCDSCRVDIRKENEEASKIYMIVQSQFIMGPAGPIDIIHSAIYSAMDVYEVKNKRHCFEKVLKLSRYFLQESRKDHG
jgi:hypothetical protein